MTPIKRDVGATRRERTFNPARAANLPNLERAKLVND
jgi:hypothetical protein